MIQTVQVSEFRNNLAEYLGKLDEGWDLEIKKGSEYVAKVSRHKKNKGKTKINRIDLLMKQAEEIWKTQPKLKKKTDYSMRIDEILYGKK